MLRFNKPIPGVSDGEGGGGVGGQGSPPDHGQGFDGLPTGEKLRLPERKKLNPDEISIRWKIYGDHADLARIEKSSWETPWTEEDFERCSRQRNVAGFVVERNKSIVGFTFYQSLKHGFEVVNLAVDPDVRRMGIGTMMVNFLISKLLIRGCTEISLTVRETNVPAQLFLGSCGFEAKRVLRRFFEDTYEDGYRMVYQLPEKP